MKCELNEIKTKLPREVRNVNLGQLGVQLVFVRVSSSLRGSGFLTIYLFRFHRRFIRSDGVSAAH